MGQVIHGKAGEQVGYRSLAHRRSEGQCQAVRS